MKICNARRYVIIPNKRVTIFQKFCSKSAQKSIDIPLYRKRILPVYQKRETLATELANTDRKRNEKIPVAIASHRGWKAESEGKRKKKKREKKMKEFRVAQESPRAFPLCASSLSRFRATGQRPVPLASQKSTLDNASRYG